MALIRNKKKGGQTSRLLATQGRRIGGCLSGAQLHWPDSTTIRNRFLVIDKKSAGRDCPPGQRPRIVQTSMLNCWRKGTIRCIVIVVLGRPQLYYETKRGHETQQPPVVAGGCVSLSHLPARRTGRNAKAGVWHWRGGTSAGEYPRRLGSCRVSVQPRREGHVTGKLQSDPARLRPSITAAELYARFRGCKAHPKKKNGG
jgi:hypothetical protein